MCHTFVRAESLDDEAVRPRLEHPGDARLETAGIVDVGELDAARFKMVARVKPEPRVVRRSLAGREGVLPGGRDSEAIEVLARAVANDVVSTGGIAGDGTPAGQISGALSLGGADQGHKDRNRNELIRHGWRAVGEERVWMRTTKRMQVGDKVRELYARMRLRRKAPRSYDAKHEDCIHEGEGGIGRKQL